MTSFDGGIRNITGYLDEFLSEFSTGTHGKDCGSSRPMHDTVKSFRDLLLWQKSLDLSVRTYKLARQLPKADQMVLGYQLRKSAVSIPSNIAEGFSRHSKAHYIQHLWTSHGSAAELETQLEIGERVEAIPSEAAAILIADAQEIGRMINGLVRSLERTE